MRRLRIPAMGVVVAVLAFFATGAFGGSSVETFLPKRRLGSLSRLGVALIASLIVTALLVPGAGAHDGIMTAAGHAAEDAVVLTAAQERALDAHTRAVTRASTRGAAAAVRRWRLRTWASGDRS